MKRFTLQAALLSILVLSPIGVSAYTAYVAVDASLDLNTLNGFQFDVVGANIADLMVTVFDTTEDVAGAGGLPGALPGPPFDVIWQIYKVTNPAQGMAGDDNSGGAYPLSAGIILSLSAVSEFSLSNFLLSSNSTPSGIYPYDFSVLQTAVSDGIIYIYSGTTAPPPEPPDEPSDPQDQPPDQNPQPDVGAPEAPQLQVSVMSLFCSVSWTPVGDASGYILYYAPYPFKGLDSIGTIDMGALTSIRVKLWNGAAFYVGVKAYNEYGESDFSNVELFEVKSSIFDIFFGQ
jgi:hypothetical protein